METTPDYCKATNQAYEVLSRTHCFCVPIPIFDLIREYPFLKLQTYTDAANRSGLTFESFCELAPSEYGYSIKEKHGRRTVIVFNDRLSEEIIRFTLAHELGHSILMHSSSNKIKDSEANCFARNLLCPLPVIDGLGISKPNEYSEAFYVSEPMGIVAAQFRESDNYYITKKNYSSVNDKAYCYYTGMTLAELYGATYYY